MARPAPSIEKALRNRLKLEGRYLIAASGGVDSMSMLHAAVGLARELKLTLHAAHVDHGLRPESSEDARFVKEECDRQGVILHCRRLENQPKANIEAWARKERYSFFEEVLSAEQLDCVLTAHNANDVAETLLMRLVSNKEPTSIMDFDERRRLMRPLLSVPRLTIAEYASANSVKYREDSSNADERFLRNKIRNSLIPFIQEKFEPRVVESLANRAEELAEDHALLYSLVDEAVLEVSKFDFGSRDWVSAVQRGIAELPSGLGWRLVEKALYPKLGFNLGRGGSRGLIRVLFGEARGLELPGKIYVGLRKGVLVFTDSEQALA